MPVSFHIMCSVAWRVRHEGWDNLTKEDVRAGARGGGGWWTVFDPQLQVGASNYLVERFWSQLLPAEVR